MTLNRLISLMFKGAEEDIKKYEDWKYGDRILKTAYNMELEDVTRWLNSFMEMQKYVGLVTMNIELNEVNKNDLRNAKELFNEKMEKFNAKYPMIEVKPTERL